MRNFVFTRYKPQIDRMMKMERATLLALMTDATLTDEVKVKTTLY